MLGQRFSPQARIRGPGGFGGGGVGPTLLSSRGSITDTVDELLLRGFLSPAGHMAWTGIAATALYAAVAPGRRGRRVAGFVGAFVVAVCLHGLWDSQSSLIGTGAVAVLSLAGLAWTVHRVHRAIDRDRPGFASTGR